MVCFGYAEGMLPYEKFKNLEITEDLSKQSVMLGSCAIIALNTGIWKVMKNVAEFFVHESCGKCIPCREGGFRILEIINKMNNNKAGKKELKELEDISEYLEISFCGLGKAYGFAMRSAMKHFKKELDEKCR